MSEAPRPLVLGRLIGHRGGRGELTARIVSGEPQRWTSLERVIVRGGEGDEEFEVESARAYRDRLVIKLAGVDDATTAANLKGRLLVARAADVPRLPEGRYWLDRLVGLDVVDGARRLGRVVDVVETGGGEVLVVVPVREGGPRATASEGDDEVDDDGVNEEDEILIPLVRRYVIGVDEDEGRIRVRVPDDLRNLNRRREP